jgi:hypothetical protein
MDPGAPRDLVEDATALRGSRRNVCRLVEAPLCFLAGPPEALSFARRGGFTPGSPTALGANAVPGRDLRGRGSRDPRVGVLDLRPRLPQGPPQGGLCPRLVQMAAAVPAAATSGLYVQQCGSGHKRRGPPPGGAVAAPDVVGARRAPSLNS